MSVLHMISGQGARRDARDDAAIVQDFVTHCGYGSVQWANRILHVPSGVVLFECHAYPSPHQVEV